MAEWRMHRGDATCVLSMLPDASTDCVLADPPYGTASTDKVQKHLGKLEAFTIAWDQELPLEWLPDAVRVLVPGGALVVFTDTKRTETVWHAVEQAGARPLQLFYWHKTNPAPNPRKNFASAVEVAIFARKPGKVRYWAGGGFSHNLYTCPIVAGRARTHPTQKPVRLMEHILNIMCPPGGRVLDPFAGSASTGVAALATGRSFVGIELDGAYHLAASRRLAATPTPMDCAQREVG